MTTRLVPGEVVDRYVVEHTLGTGGMARVYAVRHAVLDTRHALKVLHGHATHAVHRERLIREGRVQARLDSEHVVPVTDVIDVNGAPALVMPLVDGCSLADAASGYRLSDTEVYAVLSGILDGVGAAHRLGVVHRDLKPANVLLELGPVRLRVRVTDFGVAKALLQAGGEPSTPIPPSEAPEPPANVDVTGQTGRTPGAGSASTTVGFVGTPAYAAPEQLDRAEQVAPIADLWSIGVIVYELVVGRRPTRRRLAAEPEPIPLDPVPAPWRRIVGGLLSLDPAARTPSVDAVREALRDALPDTPSVPVDPLGVNGGLAEAVRARRAAARTAAAAEAEAVRALTVDVDGTPLTDAPDAAARPGPRHNLPRERDAFVGRGLELDGLARQLTERGPLISLVGIGGSGKSRLALHVARAERLSSQWPGGVWMVDLTECGSPDDVARAVGQALDVPLGTADPARRLGDALAARGRLLLVLDGFEVVAEHAEATLGRWLDLAPDATVLVTTRQVLGLRGEAVFPVQPLPAADGSALFVARVAAATPGFAASAEDADAIARLVELLDGLPLAIELAAARFRVLGASGLLERMSDRFRVLTPAASATTAHRATLRATLDWSWNHLSEPERAALTHLAAFDGGFDVPAAEAVVALTADDGREPPWTLDVLQALVDRSLVRVLGDGRFDLLHCVRDYARERLAASDGQAWVRHGRWFAAYGAPARVAELSGHGGEALRRAWVRDLPNLIAACRAALRRGDAEVAGLTAVAARQVLHLTGPAGLVVELCEAALGGDVPTALAIELHAHASLARAILGDRAEADAHADRALSLAAAGGDPADLGIAHAQAAVLRHRRGEVDAAEAHYRVALDAGRARGDKRLEGSVLRNLSAITRQRGDRAQAVALAEQALAIHRATGDRRSEALAHSFLAHDYLAARALDRAERHLQAALAAFREVGDQRHVGLMLGDLGVLGCLRGRIDEATANGEAALAIHRVVGDRQLLAQEHATLGVYRVLVGDLAAARGWLERAVALHDGFGPSATHARALTELGALERQDGAFDRSAALLGRATEMARTLGDRMLAAEVDVQTGQLALARGELDAAEALFTSVIDTGRAIALDRLVADGQLGLGDVLHRRGDHARAVAVLEAAVAEMRRREDPWALAGALAVAAEAVAAEAGAGAEAGGAWAAEARAICDRVGAGPGSATVRRLDALAVTRRR